MICQRLQRLQAEFPDVVESMTLSRAEIQLWDASRNDAARQGTYMHYLFEAHLNGYAVPKTSPEFSMLTSFLQTMEGWRAFRAEWVIFGEGEKIAGSIDLCH